MKIKTAVNTPTDDVSGTADLAEFDLDQAKLYRIMRFSNTVKELGVYCIEEFDYSLSFYSFADYDEEETIPFDGRMDCCCLKVCSDRFYWTGYYKHTNIKWETDALKISDMVDALHGQEGVDHD